MATLLNAFVSRIGLAAFFYFVILSISFAQETGEPDELGESDDRAMSVGVITVGWDQFTDVNQRKFEDGSFAKLYDISEWELSETWESKIRENISANKFTDVQLNNPDVTSLLAAYFDDLDAQSKDWPSLAPLLTELAQKEGQIERLILFAPTENAISATTMFGESRTDFPGGVGIMRYNRSASYYYVSGVLYLFDGVTGKLLNEVRFQEDFGFMKSSGFFFPMNRELRRPTFADYTDEQKAGLKEQIKSSFDKHFRNSVNRLLEDD